MLGARVFGSQVFGAQVPRQHLTVPGRGCGATQGPYTAARCSIRLRKPESVGWARAHKVLPYYFRPRSTSPHLRHRANPQVSSFLTACIKLRDICVFTAPFFAGNTAMVAYLFGKELKDTETGLVAAALMAIVPGRCGRTNAACCGVWGGA